MPTTHEQSDFAHCKFLVFCSLQPTKSACSAATEKCLSGVGQPLSSVSGRKRYNTLDFLSWLSANSCKSRVPTGMLLAPIGNPEPRDASRLPARSVLQNASHFEVSTRDPHPSGHPHIFLENGTQTVKMQFDTFPQKIQNRCNLHPCGDEKYSGFPFASPVFSYIYEGLRKIIIPFELKQKRYLAHHSTTLHRTVTRLAPPGVQV